MYEFADSFFCMLLDIQQDQPDIIAPNVDVINDYGISGSERWGATTRAQADKVSEDVINWTNHWNIGEDDVVHGPVCVVHSEFKQMLDTFLAFSLPLWRLLWGFDKTNRNFWQYDYVGELFNQRITWIREICLR